MPKRKTVVSRSRVGTAGVMAASARDRQPEDIGTTDEMILGIDDEDGEVEIEDLGDDEP